MRAPIDIAVYLCARPNDEAVKAALADLKHKIAGLTVGDQVHWPEAHTGWRRLEAKGRGCLVHEGSASGCTEGCASATAPRALAAASTRRR